MDNFVVFQKLEGPWRFERNITSHHPKLPSGKVTGEALFERITPDLLHYTEHGIFTTTQQASTDANMTYTKLLIDFMVVKIFLGLCLPIGSKDHTKLTHQKLLFSEQ